MLADATGQLIICKCVAAGNLLLHIWKLLLESKNGVGGQPGWMASYAAVFFESCSGRSHVLQFADVWISAMAHRYDRANI